MEEFWRAFDHTGDLGLEVLGGSWEALFEHASRAWVDIVANPNQIDAKHFRFWQLRAADLRGLLVRQLEELIYRMDAEGMIFAKFSIRIRDEQNLSCEAWGEALDRARHGFKTELKAVTYHGLKLWQADDETFMARIIFDV